MVLKDDAKEALEAISAVAGGQRFLSTTAQHLLLDFLHACGVKGNGLLTPKELSVLECGRRGMTYKEIASSFGISPETVHTHHKSIHRKLRVTSTAEAIAVALEFGLLQASPNAETPQVGAPHS